MVAKSLRIPLIVLVYLAIPLFLGACAWPPPSEVQTGPGEYLFCHWNVENFFDDKPAKRHFKADQEFDTWFSSDPKIFQEKLDKLTEALLKMNGGKGPDVLSIVEVETPRAAEKLMDALNAKLQAADHYKHVLMKELDAGRHIAPAIITRLAVNENKTTLHGHQQRILEGRVLAGGKELIVLSSHWTSRITEGSEKGRAHYADTLYQTYKDYCEKDRAAAILVCGDFNDTPQDDSVVKHLHSSSDVNEVRPSTAQPLLFNLFGRKDAAGGYGTYYYNGKWTIFDQILVSPTMLGTSGWVCEPDTAATFNSLYRSGDIHKRPWRFGEENNKGPRGYSDHFPVTVKLRVAGG
jgi:endonuclease/exonuclease/phosphatase family metal-dependent hydrolase